MAGILVPPGSDEALAAALDRLLADPETARGLGREAARRADADFRLEAMVSRYAAVYR
jgi:glycosyltransferase involved in cell wall biosynthesis